MSLRAGPAGDHEGEDAGPSQQQRGEGEAAADASQHQQQHNPFGFPLSLVKRIMCLDPDVSRISGGHFPPRALQMHACALCQAT